MERSTVVSLRGIELSVMDIHWDTRPVVNRMVQWVENVARGKEDCRQSLVRAEFVGGGAIGPLASRI